MKVDLGWIQAAECCHPERSEGSRASKCYLELVREFPCRTKTAVEIPSETASGVQGVRDPSTPSQVCVREPVPALRMTVAQDDKKKAGTSGWSRRVCWLVARIKSKYGGKAPNSLEPLRGPEGPLPLLRAPPRPHRQIAHLHQDARHLHSVQLRNEWQELGDELIFHQLADFFLTSAFSSAEQFGHGHLQCARQPFQGRQRGRGFFVLDF